MARGDPDRRRSRSRFLPEVRALTFRNRELAFLIVVGILTAVGFASVYIARQSVISTASLAYAGFFFGLYLAAHLVTRYAVPFADPYLLPIAGLLTAIGLTEIYRLNPDDAFRQGIWIVVALILFAATLFLLRYDYRRLETFKYLFGITAIALLVLPILPVLGLTVNGARLWVHIGSLRFQPGELAKIMLIVFLAGYMREKREVLAQGRPKDWGPLLTWAAGSSTSGSSSPCSTWRRRGSPTSPRDSGCSSWVRSESGGSPRTFVTASRSGFIPGRSTRSSARSRGRWIYARTARASSS
ncbi:MAG: hypothetical protein E6G33_06865 [Actinobacteria bacterium]|nr:MAG: hypothetical protein E6G33_06865 [Actinomycetota bacterium]